MSYIDYTPSNTTLPMDFDPFNQNVTFLMSDGGNASVLITTSAGFLNMWKVETQKGCLVYGSQLGASLIMLMMVAITTRQSKRLQPIFWLNMLSLLLSFLRALFLGMYFFGPFQDIYPFVSGDFSRVSRGEYHTSVWTGVVALFLLCTIEASLVLQTNVVCLTMAAKWRRLVVVFTVVVVLLSCISRLVLTIFTSRAILGTQLVPNGPTLLKLNLATETATIWYFCAIFVGKLLWTMYVRRRMGLRQWGPMKIICICGGCTMVIPSIFAGLEWMTNQTFPYAGSITLTAAAIFLPLSSVWASMSVSDSHSPKHLQEPRLQFGSHDSRSGDHNTTGGSSRRGLMDSLASAFDRKNSRCSGKSTFGTNSTMAEYRDEQDVEAQRHANVFGGKGQSMTMVRKGSEPSAAEQDIEMRDGVRIERVFEVQRGAAPGGSDGGEAAQARARGAHQNMGV